MNELTQLDQQIVDLIGSRCRLVAKSIRQKSPVTLPEAMQSVDQFVAAMGGDSDVTKEAIRHVMRHLVSVCYQTNAPRTVAFLGPIDSYSHLAAIEYFGQASELTPVSSIEAVFDAVSRGDCDQGIVPIENSTDGRVVDTLGRLAKSDTNIVGEVLVPIHHNLLAKCEREKIEEVHSKPQALSQCRNWLANHLPSARLVETASTAAAAKAAASSDRIAAVASVQAGQRYGLNVVAASIEDNRDNVTRFAVLGSDAPSCTGDDKSTLLFQVKHQPGALAEVMGILRDHELNLTWIESFPQMGLPNEYFFIVEFPGHQEEQRVGNAIADLRKQTEHLNVLGSYPRGRLAK